MSEDARMWMEVSFNIGYLLAIWALVGAMVAGRRATPPGARPAGAGPFLAAFALLALGDTGHVGFRVWAYAQGSLDATVNLLGREVGLVGLGALSTAVTITCFYLLLLLVWRRRYRRPWGALGILLLMAGLVRFLVMIPAQNEWSNVVPPEPWGLIRNAPLVVLGLGVAYLLLRDARAHGDRPFFFLGLLILVSYAFYAPVILFVQEAPLVGMLMIPKTLAYVAMAVVGYRALFVQSEAERQPA